jgi:hypothetical protein
MEIENAMGECDWVLPRKEAIIRILDPVDYPENKIFTQDMERTLVHELLHLHFAPLAIHDTDEILLEQAMHGIDGALVRLNRNGV